MTNMTQRFQKLQFGVYYINGAGQGKRYVR